MVQPVGCGCLRGGGAGRTQGLVGSARCRRGGQAAGVRAQACGRGERASRAGVHLAYPLERGCYLSGCSSQAFQAVQQKRYDAFMQAFEHVTHRIDPIYKVR